MSYVTDIKKHKIGKASNTMNKKPSKHSQNIKRKIRKVCKLLDKKIDKIYCSENIDEWFEALSDREKVTTISKGDYCSCKILQKIFDKYKIK